MAFGLAAPRVVSAESGIVFDASKGTMTGQLDMATFPLINVSSISMSAGGLMIATGTALGASGVIITKTGEIRTVGAGSYGVEGGVRGPSAVDLQTYREQQTQVAAAWASVISGGAANAIDGMANAGVIAGGYNNAILTDGYGYSVIGGGTGNTVAYGPSVVAGGEANRAGDAFATVSGGYQNSALGIDSTIAGGAANNASGSYSAVGGGELNWAAGDRGVVAGGSRNTAAGTYSFAAGRASSSTASGTFTWADSQGSDTANSVADRTMFKNRGGFLVTGSTNSYMAGALNRGVLMTGAGLVGISTGVPYAALDVVSTGTTVNDYAQVWRDSAGLVVASMTANGKLTTLQTLPGDNLGNHTATQALNMGGYAINSSSNITAAYYQIAGSTVLAMLPGTGSLGIGVGAGQVNTGSYNIFFGGLAGSATTTGSDNSFLGYSAGRDNTMGYNNVSVGYYAGLQNTSGSYNSYFGVFAGEFNHTGSANVLIGSNAGLWGNSFSSSTIVGASAGYSLSTGSDNIFLGFKAGYSVTTGTGNIIIGYNVGPSGVAANNEINIGNVYKGNVSSGTAQIPRVAVQAADAGIALVSADFGKTITVNSASAQTVTLPSVTAADIGATITVVKLGAGKVTIQAAASTYIADSSAAGTLYNSAVSPAYASVTLVLVSSNRWMLVGGYGAWITT